MNTLWGNPPPTDPRLQQSSLPLVESSFQELGSLLREGRVPWVLSIETSALPNPSNLWTYLPPGISEPKQNKKSDPLIRAEGRKQGVSFSPLRNRKFLSRTFCKPGSFFFFFLLAEWVDLFPPLKEPFQNCLETLSPEVFKKTWWGNSPFYYREKPQMGLLGYESLNDPKGLLIRVKSCCPATFFPDLHSTGTWPKRQLTFLRPTVAFFLNEAHPCNTASATQKQKDTQVDQLPQRSWQIPWTLIWYSAFNSWQVFKSSL